MAPDLINLSDKLCYINVDGEYKEIQGVSHLHCDVDSEDYNYCSIDFDDTPHEFTFNMKKKQWYRMMKILGLIKPRYKRIKKGKRYVRYEDIRYYR